MSDAETLLARMLRDDRFSASELSSWMFSDDVEVLGAVFQILYGSSRIDGEVDAEEANQFLLTYLLAVMQGRTATATVFTLQPYVAAHELARLYKHLRQGLTDPSPMLKRVGDSLSEMYIQGENPAKRLVVDGALEHIFEDPRSRADFGHWAIDDQLRTAFEEAMAWANSHQDAS
jgi:hypothetical protein